MPPIPPPNQADEEHLNLLSVFHFVGAGLAFFGLLFLFGHYQMMHTVFTNTKLWATPIPNGTPVPPMPPPPPMPMSPKEFFAIFQWFYLVFGAWFVMSGVLNFMSGFYLRARKNRLFSLVVAGVNCLHVPLGTVLGVFTIIVLGRESVRRIYGELRQ
jgi:hypothetical protein